MTGFVCLLLLSDEIVRDVCGLRRNGVAFYKDRTQLCRQEWGTVDRVEVRFRASKGDQLRLGVIMKRVRSDPASAFREGGGAVGLMAELSSVSDSYPVDAPMMTYGVRDANNLLMWTRYDAVATLRQVVTLARGFRTQSLRCTVCALVAPPTCRQQECP